MRLIQLWFNIESVLKYQCWFNAWMSTLNQRLYVNVESTFVCQRWINVCMSSLNQRLYVIVESTFNQRLYVSVYSSFKFKYIFIIISTYIVNVESTLNQQTRACWVYTTGWLNIHLIFYVIHEKIGLSHGNMICIILRKFMIYSPKYEVIALPGRVGMEEFSLVLIFY